MTPTRHIGREMLDARAREWNRCERIIEGFESQIDVLHLFPEFRFLHVLHVLQTPNPGWQESTIFEALQTWKQRKNLFISMKLNQKILLLLFCPIGRRCSFENGPGVIFAKNSPRHRLASCRNGYSGSYWDKNDSIIWSILFDNFVQWNNFYRTRVWSFRMLVTHWLTNSFRSF